jgi:hypothetical protein
MSPPFDAVYSFEVIEHVPDALSGRMLDFLVSLAPAIIFTGAHPGQGGTGHINEQPKSHWIEQFASRGFIFDGELTDRIVKRFREAKISATWLQDNLIVARSQSGTPKK